MPLTINDAGLAIIKVGEGLYLTAIQDPGGVWTIGWGHTLGVVAGQHITQAQAEALLAQDLANFERGVGAVANSPSSNQFSAMVSLAFNIGMAAFKRSTALREHNAGNFSGAADAFLLWDKAHVDGQLVVLPGLDKRRAAERELYLTADSAKPPPPEEATITIPTPTQGTDQAGNKVKLSWKTSAAAAVVAGMAGFGGGVATQSQSVPTQTVASVPSVPSVGPAEDVVEGAACIGPLSPHTHRCPSTINIPFGQLTRSGGPSVVGPSAQDYCPPGDLRRRLRNPPLACILTIEPTTDAGR